MTQGFSRQHRRRSPSARGVAPRLGLWLRLCIALVALGLGAAAGPALAQNLITWQTPEQTDVSDNVPYELGLKFTAARPGVVTALRHWKSPSESGTHVGRLWSANGTLLASATFTNEGVSGWQQVVLPAPVRIEAGVTYVVSVNVNRHFPITFGGLGTKVTSGDLSSVADGANGVFGAAGAFPTGSYRTSNYFRDLIFYADAGSTAPPPPPAASGNTVFTTQTPSAPNVTDGVPYELGMKFRSARSGQITHIRYYKASSEAGNHTGRIWSSTGTLLASVAFADNAGSGWKEQALPTPLAIQAATTYVVSVNANSHFAFTPGGLSSSVANGDLASVADGANGVFSGSPGAFPTGSYQSGNYFRDVVFVAGASSGAPTISKDSGDGQSGAAGTKLPAPLVVRVLNADGTPKVGQSVSFSAVAGGGSVSPTSASTDSTGRAGTSLTLGTAAGTNTVRASATGVGSVDFSATGTSSAPPPTASGTTLFTTQTPGSPNVTDGVGYELGMKFRAARSGHVTAIRHYKASSETGAHTGRIWSSTGTLLASVSFADNTGSGWKQQALATPLAIQANTTYVVSVNANSHFAYTQGGLASQITNGDLSSVADGANGVFASPGAFPAGSYQSSNYFRDVVFAVDPNAPPPPPPSEPPPPSSTENAILLENQKTGSPSAIPDLTTRYTSTVIAGYTTAPSVNRGGQLGFKVSTSQPGQYAIDVYRFGWYGGAGARLVTSSGTLNGVTQTPCAVTDRATRLVECKWATSYTLNVGSDWTSGIYMAKLRHFASGREHPVYFIVRDDASRATAVFQSSRSNALAYNSYGTPTERYSLYNYSSTGGTAAFKVSLDRPSNEDEDYNSLRWHEYNMVLWLESQGYDLTYITNFDVHANPSRLLNHRVFLSVGHDEYWSLEMRNAVEGARDAGVNLAFFTANAAYWRVRFEPSSSGVPNRVMVCYKESWGSDPVAPTNRWRDPPNNRPENALLGVMYIGDHSGLYDGFDFVVTNSGDKYYANTGLSNGSRLAKLVGYEWDAVVNNGFTPPGLVILGASPVTAQGIAPGMPTTSAQTSHAVRYTAASGAKVFATGSIQWMWGLNSAGVSPARVDARAQQMAVNVLADMGARPATPSAGIVVP